MPAFFGRRKARLPFRPSANSAFRISGCTMIHILDTKHLGRPASSRRPRSRPTTASRFSTRAQRRPSTIFPAAMRAAGFAPNDVRHVFLSHIHLDHAGAAWRFAEQGATIHVHPRGARHLVDPSKLMESATRIFGDDMGRLWGEMRPIPEDKVQSHR